MTFSLRFVFLVVLALFLISAFISALISYNTSLAWSRFVTIALGIAVCVVFAVTPEDKSQILAMFLPAIVLVYFLLTNDWTSRLGKVASLDTLLQWFAVWQLQLPGLRLDSNSLGGVLAALMPLQVGSLSLKGKLRTWGGIALVAVSGIGLLLSESRGAWLAVAIITGLSGLWLLIKRIIRNRSSRIVFFASMVVILAITFVLVLTSTQGQNLIQGRSDRLYVWRNSWDLATDYLFTGLGLGGFEMAYSSYMILLHVGHTIHAHNLFLDVWLEQGLLGLFTFVLLMVVACYPLWNAFRQRQSLSVWKVAAIASLGVIIFHGMTDDPYYGYGGVAIPFLFFPLGMLANAIAVERLKLSQRFAAIASGVLAVVLVAIALMPSIRANFAANLGALAQTQAELSVYRWPDVPIQDELRRFNRIDLSPAIAQYQIALALDLNSATANRRLGQIELSQGKYEAASQHIQMAFASAPNQRATRQLLGELYAIAGDVNQARTLWLSIDVSDGQLPIRQWWYEHIGKKEWAERIQLAMAQSLDQVMPGIGASACRKMYEV